MYQYIHPCIVPSATMACDQPHPGFQRGYDTRIYIDPSISVVPLMVTQILFHLKS